VPAIGVIDHRDPLQADRMWALQQASYAVEAELIGFSEIPPLLEDVEAILHLDLVILGATDHGDLVGIVGYQREAGCVDIDRFAVHPTYFRRGYGRALIEALHVREQDAAQFTVSTGADNLPAVALYGALDYVLVSEETSLGIRIAHFVRHAPVATYP
jgi:ribosomal protein S18 acetylase RimI-like enzyme